MLMLDRVYLKMLICLHHMKHFIHNLLNKRVGVSVWQVWEIEVYFGWI